MHTTFPAFAANSRFSLDVIYNGGICGTSFHCTYEGQKFVVQFRRDIEATLGGSRFDSFKSSVSLVWESEITDPRSYRRGQKKTCARALKRGDRRLKPILYRVLKSLETGAHNAVEM